MGTLQKVQISEHITPPFPAIIIGCNQQGESLSKEFYGASSFLNSANVNFHFSHK